MYMYIYICIYMYSHPLVSSKTCFQDPPGNESSQMFRSLAVGPLYLWILPPRRRRANCKFNDF